jgi:hypothetical protein
MLRRQQIVLEQGLNLAISQKQNLLVEQLIEQLPRHTNANGMVLLAVLLAILAVQIRIHLEKLNLVVRAQIITTACTIILAAKAANA